MTMRASALTLALLAAGCGGDGKCELEPGQYEGTFTEVRGDCGAIPTVSVSVPEGGYPIFGAGMDCPDSSSDFSDDNCTATTNGVCVLDDGSEVSIMSTVMYAGRTEAEAAAEISIEGADGSSCRSRYDVWWRQL